jgi:hypothetical protein
MLIITGVFEIFAICCQILLETREKGFRKAPSYPLEKMLVSSHAEGHLQGQRKTGTFFMGAGLFRNQLRALPGGTGQLYGGGGPHIQI